MHLLLIEVKACYHDHLSYNYFSCTTHILSHHEEHQNWIVVSLVKCSWPLGEELLNLVD